jgi:xylan 1,4-beta-xylosidase
MRMIENPILKGFNPDPSIIRVGEDYYIATSTFEWFPGVQIHHSRDLINWKLIAHPLNRISQLYMRGVPDSGGIWAPCLSYDNGTFYLVYTNVKSVNGLFKDTHNYLVTTKDITGEWSEPVHLNSDGFDPSLFHDTDGRKWLTNMVWDHRKGRNPFGGIMLQEYFPEEKKLVGSPLKIFTGTKLMVTEGPHLYKLHGYYYLLTAEGGTHFGHAVTMARATSITGPYEVDPQNPILTSRYDVTLPLQRSGHADIVETQEGQWYMVHLSGRPIPTKGRCILGRETCIQKVYWTEDKWLRLAQGGNTPAVMVQAPELPEHPWESEPERDDFEDSSLNIHFQTLRIPQSEDFLSLTERPGYLRLKGQESLSSWHRQSMVARRQQSFKCTAATCIEFEPESYKQMAGLICYYDTRNYYYLYVSHDEVRGKYLNILTCVNNSFNYPIAEICIEGWQRCHLKAQINYDQLRFSYSRDGIIWTEIDAVFDHSTLSDEFCWAQGIFGCFTGAFIGLCCQDLSGKERTADFDYFEYSEDNYSHK